MIDREYLRIYFKDRRAVRIKAGLCVNCGNEPAREGRTLGVDCKKKSDDYYRRKRDRNSNARIC